MASQKNSSAVQLFLLIGLGVIVLLLIVMIILLALLLSAKGSPSAVSLSSLPNSQSTTTNENSASSSSMWNPPTDSRGSQSTTTGPDSNAKKHLSLVEVVTRSFYGSYFSPHWDLKGNYFKMDDYGNILHIDTYTAQLIRSVILTNTTLISLNVSNNYKFSADMAFVVFKSNSKQIWRHSSYATYIVVQLNGTKIMNTIQDARLFMWNPTLGKSDYVYVTSDQNIVHVADPANPMKSNNLTNSSDLLQFYGIPDWLYEEEITSDTNTIHWSKDGTHIAYLHMNDTGVKNIQYSMYEDGSQYPIIKSVPYPKVGTKNPSVQVYVAKLDGSQSILAKTPQDVLDWGDFYIFHVNWMHSGAVVVVFTNRAQTSVKFAQCKSPMFACTTLLTTKFNIMKMQQWADPSSLKIFPTEDNSFLTIIPNSLQGSQMVFDQIVNVSLTVPGNHNYVTSDPFDVLSIKSYINGAIYFTRPSPLQSTSLWMVKKDGTASCISCTSPVACNSSSVNFAPSKDRFVLTCSSTISPPHAYFIKLTDPNSWVLMKNNTKVLDKLSQYSLPNYQFMEVPIHAAKGNVPLNAAIKLYLPPNFDATKKYPVLLYVYGGPGSVAVHDSWSVGIGEYFAATRGYIYVNIDGRGSGNKGWNMKSPIYGASGTVEIEDSVVLLKSLLDNNKFMDRTRVGVWGWSYGGYTTAAIVEQQQILTNTTVFQCAASVAPVTDFRYYDTAYTERFMGLWEDNKAGYMRTNLHTNVTGFHYLNQYLLMHGNADDNVHFQNSAMLVKALLASDVRRFSFLMFPNEQHSLRQSKIYVYDRIDRFFQQCFGL